MKIGVDIDGVIANFVEEFINLIKEKYGEQISEKDIIYHDLYQVLGISEEEASGLIDIILHRDLNIIDGADKYISMLSNHNDIYVLTARNININITKKWLEKHGIKYKKLILFKEGDKNFCETKLDVIVEDNLKEAIGFIGKCKKIIIYDHPWNKTIDVYNSFYRANNWQEIYEKLSAYARSVINTHVIPSQC